MTRRSRESGKRAKPRNRKTVMPKRRSAPIAASRTPSIADLQARIDRQNHELIEARELQAATEEVLRVISGSPNDSQPVFDTVAENAVRVCKGQFAFVMRFDNELLRFSACHGLTPEGLEVFRRSLPRPAGDDTAAGRAILRRAVVQIPDVVADPTYGVVDVAQTLIYRSALAAPMLRDGNPIGVVAVARAQIGSFSVGQVALLQTFARQAVIAVENVRLFNETKEALEQQTATSEVLKVISRSTFDLQTVLDTLVQSATRLCEAENNVIFLRDGNNYRIAAHYGVTPDIEEYLRRHPISPGRNTVTGRVALEGRVVHIPDVLADPEYRYDGQPLGGYRAQLGVPLLREANCVGTMSIGRNVPQPFTAKQIELATTFAAQAVIAIENARLLRELRERTDQLANLNQQLEQRVIDQVGEIERMSRLRRFLPPQVADLIVASGTEKQLESHRREITALFCDLRGFTGFSEGSDPEDVMALLRDYHAAIGQIIFKYGGTLERFAGDGVMVIFNDPVPAENPALQAVLMALDMRAAIGAMIEKWRDLGHDLGFGIGIEHGFATLGTIGFEGRFDYAAIGTVSNVASRLCDEAKPGQILISARVRQAVAKAVTIEAVGEFTLKGIRRPMMTYNVLSSSLLKPN
jgi:class 3 adenylate cyclase/putative methionine-R-sulfoxide reductase with GAF domain